MPSTSSCSPGAGLGQEHRLVAEALVAQAGARRCAVLRRRSAVPSGRAGRRPRPPRRPGSRGAGAVTSPVRNAMRALEHPEQALPAGVDDAGLAQDRQERRRLRDGRLGGLDRRRHDRLEGPLALRAHDGGRRGLADDGQDRALDRLGDGAVGRLRALVERVREVERVELRLAGEPLGDARAGSGS